ncbi:MAG TPA: CBS domain-containing protein [Planctomycetaceae bacterium]|nr:CBS domain-containing protein [Planctomycetaceae bacterium]
MLTARDVMTTNVITISSAMTVEEAIHILLLNGISGAPVVDESGKVVGIISEFQLLVVVYNSDAKEESVADFMTKGVVSVGEEAPLTEVANKMVVHRIRRLPVVDRGNLVGLISRPDLLRYAIDAAVPLRPELVLAESV